MNQRNKIMAALDLSENDDAVLGYINFIAKPLGIKEVVSTHVLLVLLVGGIVKLAIGEILLPVAPALGVIHKDIEAKTKKIIGGEDLEIKVKLVEGRAYTELLNLAEELKPDLLVMGKKRSKSGSGITAKRMARHIKCDLLLIPEETKPQIRRILVAVDFSSHSVKAIERAISLSTELGLEEPPICLNVIDVPTYAELSKGEEIADELPDYINVKFERFLVDHTIDRNKVDFHFTKTSNYNIAKTIKRYAKREGADLIFLGAKGHNIIERFLLGSVAETMVDEYVNTPVYIVR